MTEQELREKIAKEIYEGYTGLPWEPMIDNECKWTKKEVYKHTDKILTLIKEAGWKSPDKCSERKDVLLKATYDLLKKCDNSPFVVDVFSEIVFYDEADCDGYCLMEDIKNELRIDDE